MELLSSLKALDFSENESVIYAALLELSSKSDPYMTAGPILQATGFHRNVAYTALNKLKSMKLVNTRTIRGRTYFAAGDPSVLEELFLQKAKVAKEVSKIIELKLSKDQQEITIHQGNEEYLTLLTSILNSLPMRSTKLVLGTGGKDFMNQTMWPIWQRYHEVAFKRQLRIKMLSYESQREALKFDDKSKKIYEIRFLSDDIENPAGMHIYRPVNTVLNIIYSDRSQPVTAIKTKNAKLAVGYENLFKNLWKTAKP